MAGKKKNLTEKIHDAFDAVVHPNSHADQDVETSSDSSDESSEESDQAEGRETSSEHDPEAILKHTKFDKFKKET